MSQFNFTYLINEQDCDKNGNLKTSVLLELFTKAACDHYDSIGLPRDKLESENMRFLLLQTAAKIYAMPKANEEITVSTRESGMDGIYFDRAYEVFNKNGEKLISADGHWILTDNKHRILSPKKFPYGTENNEPADISCKRMPKFTLSDFSSGIIHKVEAKDIDINGHVHNTVYADVACEYMPTEFWNKKWTEFHINWRNEAKLGDEWELFTTTDQIFDTEEYRCVGFIGEHHSFDFLIKAEKSE